MAYYAEGRGGFYIAAKDNHGSDKDLNFYKAQDNKSLTCEIAHIQWDARPGKSLVVDYPIVIAALTQGTWYEAAERYRAWAIQQPWCKRGTLRRRVAAGDACRWLLEKIGGVGMWWPFRDDIREDIVRTRRLFGAPLLHLELWWRHEPSREAAQSDGDRFGPFYFPFLALKGKDAFECAPRGPNLPPGDADRVRLGRDVSGPTGMAQRRVRIGRGHGRRQSLCDTIRSGWTRIGRAATPTVSTMTSVPAPAFPRIATRPTTFTRPARAGKSRRLTSRCSRKAAGGLPRQKALMFRSGPSASASRSSVVWTSIMRATRV